MDPIETLGNMWRSGRGGTRDVVLMLISVTAVIAALILLKYVQQRKRRALQGEKILQNRVRRLGLSKVQHTILNALTLTLRLPDPTLLLDDSLTLESAIAKAHEFLYGESKTEHDIAAVSMDIIMIYEKIINPGNYRQPHNSISDIEMNKLVFFSTDGIHPLIGKVVSKSASSIFVNPLWHIRTEDGVAAGNPVKAFFLRLGDAQYLFQSSVKSVEGRTVEILLPESFERSIEFRHRYLDVIIPTQMWKAEPGEEEEGAQIIACTQFKINEYETVIRTDQRLDFNNRYTMEFIINDFKVVVHGRIIVNRPVKETNTFYYTLKFEDLSDAARAVLKKYISEQMVM